jgi:hypothetical protein
MTIAYRPVKEGKIKKQQKEVASLLVTDIYQEPIMNLVLLIVPWIKQHVRQPAFCHLRVYMLVEMGDQQFPKKHVNEISSGTSKGIEKAH